MLLLFFSFSRLIFTSCDLHTHTNISHIIERQLIYLICQKLSKNSNKIVKMKRPHSTRTQTHLSNHILYTHFVWLVFHYCCNIAFIFTFVRQTKMYAQSEREIHWKSAQLHMCRDITNKTVQRKPEKPKTKAFSSK